MDLEVAGGLGQGETVLGDEVGEHYRGAPGDNNDGDGMGMVDMKISMVTSDMMQTTLVMVRLMVAHLDTPATQCTSTLPPALTSSTMAARARLSSGSSDSGGLV